MMHSLERAPGKREAPHPFNWNLLKLHAPIAPRLFVAVATSHCLPVVRDATGQRASRPAVIPPLIDTGAGLLYFPAIHPAADLRAPSNKPGRERECGGLISQFISCFRALTFIHYPHRFHPRSHPFRPHFRDPDLQLIYQHHLSLLAFHRNSLSISRLPCVNRSRDCLPTL
jgi:hypothetical protein